MRDHTEIWRSLDVLWDDVPASSQFFVARPLLAHYTSMRVLEDIVRTNEVWFSNPLLMNDIEEVRFGIIEGTSAFLQMAQEASFPNSACREHFAAGLQQARRAFEQEHAFDTYILCFSCHTEQDGDGLLSMWRGYGDSGRGAAIVFDARYLTEPKNTPLILSKVHYGSTDERMSWFRRTMSEFLEVSARHQFSDLEFGHAAMALFARLRTYALFTKHQGFAEEKEWRLAYLPERDSHGTLKPFLGYFNGPRGVEPKLKFRIEPSKALDDQPFSLEKLVHSIILGPSAASPLAMLAAQRMLEKHGRTQLASRVVASRIPYRLT